MDKALRSFIEDNDFKNDDKELLIETIAASKSRLKKMNQMYESMTPEKYEEDRKKLKDRISKLETKIIHSVKLFQENLADKPVVSTEPVVSSEPEQPTKTSKKVKKNRTK